MLKLDQTELKKLTGRLSIVGRYLDDFSPLFGAEVNAEAVMPAASVIKLAIMASLLDEATQGRLQFDEMMTLEESDFVGGAGILFELSRGRAYSLEELCRLMIVVSDNTASNSLAKRIGWQALQSFWDERGYDARMNRYFMHPVVDGRDNTMTALGAARILRDLYQGVGLSSRFQRFAIETLRRQQYREKIPLMLPESLCVGHKTGELDGVRHDAAVIEASRPYILVVMTAEGQEPWLVDQAIARLSLGVFQTLRLAVGSVEVP